VVVERNWRSRTGEIDIVAKAEDLVVLCEVKTRSSERFGAPVEAITPAKLRRMRRLAAEWLASTRETAAPVPKASRVRLDVASVMVVNGELVVEVLEGVD
jgi:putative endonuclease